jgi:outer membrane receptor for ferric coprogen and ferric-rhodotorulic acid
MFVQQPVGTRFSPSLLALAICLSGTQTTLAADTEKAPAPLELGATEISGEQLGETTEGTQSYTTGAMATATKLPLTMRETPQAVTVITRQRMDDQAMTSVNDVVKNTPGLFLSQADWPGRQS